MQRELREEYIKSGSDGEWSELKFAKWVVSEMKKSKNANWWWSCTLLLCTNVTVMWTYKSVVCIRCGDQQASNRHIKKSIINNWSNLIWMSVVGFDCHKTFMGRNNWNQFTKWYTANKKWQYHASIILMSVKTGQYHGKRSKPMRLYLRKILDIFNNLPLVGIRARLSYEYHNTIRIMKSLVLKFLLRLARTGDTGIDRYHHHFLTLSTLHIEGKPWTTQGCDLNDRVVQVTIMQRYSSQQLCKLISR